MAQLDFLDTGFWVVRDIAPHVSIAFKRMFGGIPKGATPPYQLIDTPTRAADLDWFMHRYPLTQSQRAKVQMAIRLDEFRANQVRLEELRGPGYKPSIKHGFREPEKPMPYQVRAAEILRQTGRLLLLDDVGLGKTVSALAACSDGWGLPAVVVVQPHLSTQWVNQYIKRFTHLRAYEVKDRKVRDLPEADIYLFRYSNLGAWSDYAGKLGHRLIVFDEVQELRHGLATEKGRGAFAFANSAEYRMGLSATPIYNYGSEMFSVIELIAPGALGSWHEFIVDWCFSNGTHWIVSDPPALGSFLQENGIALRRTCDDAEVAMTLPALHKSPFEVDWNEGDAQSDRELQQRLAMRVLKGGFYERGTAARELDMLMRHETGVAKARAVAAYSRTLIEAGEPVVICGWHRDVYDIWLSALSDHNPVMFTGSESAAAKRRSREAFVNGDSNVMIMSLRSGAGLDGLQQRCAHIVFGELDWSPQVHVQATGRIHRTGQPREVTAHYLHVNGGSDPVVMSMLGLKASQSHGILNPYAGVSEATPIDNTRIKQLARAVLEIGDNADRENQKAPDR